MEGVGQLLNVVKNLWVFVSKSVSIINDFTTNKEALENALEQLVIVSEDVKTRVKLQEESHLVPTKQVCSWLQRVRDINNSVNHVLERAGQISERSSCLVSPNECWSSYKLGEELKEKLKAVQELKSERETFHSIAEAMPRGVVDEQPLGDTVGLNSAFAEVQGWIEDSEVKIIGIYGMPGVGKTTLLQTINNSFLRTNYGFDRVIWVIVSRPSSIGKVQDAIGEQLNLTDNAWENKSEEAKKKQIFKIFCEKKFVLMLDDVWERLNLKKVGVPPLNDQRMPKVVFTTRFEDVCDQMNSNQKIKVECLTKEAALALFKKKVGMSTLNAHPSIQKLAELLVDECKGLPLAIITVGRAMAGKTNVSDWDRAVNKLRGDPSTIPGVEDDVFRILKFSYDSLPNDTMRSCFVYCCIYPEDYPIQIVDLLNLWIGEGFLDKYKDVHEARDQGQEIINHLTRASLLENIKGKEHVKMHDVIRDMAIWISNGYKGETNKYLVFDNISLFEAQFGTTTVEAQFGTATVEAKRVSLWGNVVGISAEVQHSWSNTITFIARPGYIDQMVDPRFLLLIGRQGYSDQMFDSRFFLCMPVLKLLDLSNNHRLSKLPPGIGKLVELEFFNLSDTKIRELPVELKNLTKMKYLLLEWTSCIVIPRQVISSFSLLHVFKLFRIQDSVKSDNEKRDNIKLSDSGLLEELECMSHISDMSIILYDVISVEKLMNSRKLLNCLSSLEIRECKGLPSLEISILSMVRMRHLQRFCIEHCELQRLIISRMPNLFLSGCFHNLRDVLIEGCNSLLDLTWLIYTPLLEYLNVSDCASMVEIVGDDTSDVTRVEDAYSDMFSRLKGIRLVSLPCLRSVCTRVLPFPSLVHIWVSYCPNLRRLPLDSTSAHDNMERIDGGSSWWNALEWEDEMVEPLLRPYFKPFHPFAARVDRWQGLRSVSNIVRSSG